MSKVKEARQLAMEFEQSGCYVAAIILLEQVVRLVPHDAFAWLVLSDSYTAVGKYAGCRVALDNALLHCPSDRKWIIYVRLALVEGKRGHLRESEQWFSKAAAEPEAESNHWVSVLRADNLLALEEFVLAEQLMRSLLQVEPELDDPDEVFNVLGRSLIGQNRFEEARQAFRDAVVAEASDTTKRVLQSTDHLDEAKGLANSLAPSNGDLDGPCPWGD